jgi:superfamily II DNA/RNA helicase
MTFQIINRFKSQRITYILKEIGDKKVIIFTKTKKGAENLYRDLRAQYY